MRKYIGCHLSVANGFTKMGEDALKIGADTFAFFSRNPRGGKAKEIDERDLDGLKIILNENDFGKLVAHAPYTLNPASKDKRIREFAHICMEEDLKKLENLPGNYYNFHPGSHVGQGVEEGIRLIGEMLNKIIKEDQNTIILLETMAGKGTEIGGNFHELAEIIHMVEHKDKIGVCLDTCHVHDAGYDIVHNLGDVLSEFDEIIGIEKLKALHVNDSINERGAGKDRHAKIGEGRIGKEAIINILGNRALSGLPAILETPQKSLAGYAKEIEMLRGAKC